MPEQAIDIFTHVIPGKSGVGLVVVSSRSVFGEPPTACPNTPGPVDEAPIYVKVVRLENEQLVEAGSGRLCAHLSPEALFPDPEHMRVWAATPGDSGHIPKDTLLIWDEELQGFVLPSPLPSALSGEYTCGFNHQDFCGFYDTDEHTLALLEQMLSDPPDDVSIVITARYYHALLLELNGKPDQALEEYVALYTEMPDTYWGKLAALHLEKRR